MRSWLRFALQDVQTRTYQPVLTAAHRTSSTAVPVASLPELSAARLNRYYEVDTSQLDATSPGLSERWAPLSADAETQDFLDSCKPSWIMSFLASILRLFLSVTDTNGLLSRGSMFVLSSQQAGELIGLPVREARSSGRTNLRLLDVGAGDGEVTKKLAYLFDEVHTTEVSPWMARNLRAKGYNTTVTAFIGPDVFPESVKFDVVATMNLLDRCDHPADMLRNAMRLLVPGTGRILVAVVLPFSEFVEEGTVKRRVFGPLPMNGARCQDGASFEKSLATLVTRVLHPMGLEVERISKVPYLCRGDSNKAYYTLADAILVLKPKAEWSYSEQLSMLEESGATGTSLSASVVVKPDGSVV